MKIKFAFTILSATVMMIACGGNKEQKTDLKHGQTNEEMRLKGDETVYGLACEGCNDSVVVLLPNDGSDPVRYDIIDAHRNHKVQGDIKIGDWIGVVLNKDDKKVADLKYSVIYYKAGVKVISAREMYRDACRTDYARKVEDAVVLLKDARQIFSTITAYEDSAQRVEECEKLIAEYTATADRFNKEKEKKDKRLQRGEVMKKVKIGGMIAFGLFCIGMYAFFRYFA